MENINIEKIAQKLGLKESQVSQVREIQFLLLLVTVRK